MEVTHHTEFFGHAEGKDALLIKSGFFLIFFFPPMMMKRRGMRVQNSLLVELVRTKG